MCYRKYDFSHLPDSGADIDDLIYDDEFVESDR